jgi:hypothetical protein
MMMDEINEINNFSNSCYRTTDGRQEQEQIDVSGVQVEQISKFLLEFPEAALNVHKYLQKNYYNQQELNQPINSTPKRGHPLDDSVRSANNENGQRQRPRKRFQRNKEKYNDAAQQDFTTQPQQQSIPSSSKVQQTSSQNVNQRKSIAFDQLKHAVSSNLPCFHIQWASDANRNNIPSAIQASDLIFKELQNNGVKINRFTLVGWVGKKLKLGVNNKDDYAFLVATDKWPAKINGIDIEVIKPKFTPDSFALVVRYVPRELDEEFVTNEIQRTIASADRIKRIQYTYQRRSNDYRFDVKDYQEYNSALKLGRIAIGHSWLSMTPFFPGNRLTYCTKCWCIGHLRNKCSVSARCRVCLEILTDNPSHVCKNEPKCAQCNGKYHSLDNQCQVIRDYKQRLKEGVEEAISSGKLHRLAPKAQAPAFELHEQDFPALKTGGNHQPRKWNIEQDHTAGQSNTTNVIETEKSLENINNKLSKLLDNNKRVEDKIDQLKADLKTVTLDTQLHQAVLLDVITTMKDFIQNFIPPSLTSSRYDRTSLIPVAQQFYNRFHAASIRLNDGFQFNRKVSFTPSTTIHNISSNISAKSTSNMPTASNIQFIK